MFTRILARFRYLILHCQYVVTVHAYDEMAADDLSVWDVESVFLTGEVVERQKDAKTSNSKYRLRGKSLDNTDVEVIARISVTGKAIIITVYSL